MGFDTVSRYARLLGSGRTGGLQPARKNPGRCPPSRPRMAAWRACRALARAFRLRRCSWPRWSRLWRMAARSITCNIRTEAEIENFQPRIKRKLDIESLLPDIRDGMLAAVMYGTARRSYEGDEGEQPLGKTGTCSDSASRVGWFVSYADQPSQDRGRGSDARTQHHR